jgi:hypothetical protein
MQNLQGFWLQKSHLGLSVLMEAYYLRILKVGRSILFIVSTKFNNTMAWWTAVNCAIQLRNKDFPTVFSVLLHHSLHAILCCTMCILWSAAGLM